METTRSVRGSGYPERARRYAIFLFTDHSPTETGEGFLYTESSWTLP